MGHRSQERYRRGKNGSEPLIMERKFVLLLLYYLVVDFGIRTGRVRDYGSIRRENIRKRQLTSVPILEVNVITF